MNTVTGKVVETRYNSTSYYGNPQYAVTLDNGETYLTSHNAGIAYAIGNTIYRTQDHVYTLTRAGRIKSAKTVAEYLATTDGKNKRARELHNSRF